MEVEPNWQIVESHLLSQSEVAVRQFVAQHGNEQCSFVAYAVDPYYGRFRICFDTLENGVHVARDNERRAMERRARMLTYDWSWQNAKDLSTKPRVTEYPPYTSDFAHYDYATMEFSGWPDFARSPHYPKGDRGPDDYLEGNVRITIWRIIDALINGEIVKQLNLASPCRFGYQFHDEELIVMRIVNWPAI